MVKITSNLDFQGLLMLEKT